MPKVYRVERGFENFDESRGALRKYKRGEILKPRDAVKIKSLVVLMNAGNVVELPEELAREVLKPEPAMVQAAPQTSGPAAIKEVA
jgi:hypothetical protein